MEEPVCSVLSLALQLCMGWARPLDSLLTFMFHVFRPSPDGGHRGHSGTQCNAKARLSRNAAASRDPHNLRWNLACQKSNVVFRILTVKDLKSYGSQGENI